MAVLHKSLELNLNVTDSQLGIINILFYYATVTEEFSKWALPELKKYLSTFSKSKDKLIVSKCALFYFNIGDVEKSL